MVCSVSSAHPHFGVHLALAQHALGKSAGIVDRRNDHLMTVCIHGTECSSGRVNPISDPVTRICSHVISQKVSLSHFTDPWLIPLISFLFIVSCSTAPMGFARSTIHCNASLRLLTPSGERQC